MNKYQFMKEQQTNNFRLSFDFEVIAGRIKMDMITTHFDKILPPHLIDEVKNIVINFLNKEKTNEISK